MKLALKLTAQWVDNFLSATQFLPAQLSRRPLLDHEDVATQVTIGSSAKKPLILDKPFFVSDMSFGSLSKEAKISLAKGAEMSGTGICSGEGGMLPDEQANNSKYFYELVFDKPGDLVMPIIVEFEYEDGTKERKQYPAEIWRLNDDEVTKVFPSSKVISKITVDPDEETADVDLSNNSWPKTTETKFDNFKRNQIKG